MSQRPVHALTEEIESLRRLTFSTMQASGDMGLVIAFLKESFTVPDYEHLATALLNTAKELNLDATVSLETSNGRIFKSSTDSLDHYVKVEMKYQMSQGRIIENGDTLQINYPSASLLIHNLPREEERRGQLRDTLALLLDGAEARVNSLMLTEKAREARQSKEEFFALMSHELRTPLNPIIGYSTRLEKKLGKDIDEKHAGAIKSIGDNAQTLLHLLNHIIDVGKLENGEIYIAKEEFNVGEMVDKALSLASPIINTHASEVLQRVPNNLCFKADKTRFVDIVASLLSYASKTAQNGSIYVSAIVHKDQGLRLSVSNRGEPMKEAYHKNIFESFADRNLSNINHSNELGVGLYLTKKLVELHRGTITLESEETGNTFEIQLPHIDED